ncbi:PIH1_CS domain-containing protein [Caerostris extrusa]|uniref:PIH1_CS domain-containing protein n=1 Tax=Caerostris extrusa TaxID=172846 RepID=A0AAV4TDV3_CAEEX|nr:PIH1_CS domain-containing protein [Caerostris extrusa]
MGYTDKVAPKHIIIEVQLPDVIKASDIELDITERKLLLKSCQGMNHSYNLSINLSYAIDKEAGTAKFDKTKKCCPLLFLLKREVYQKRLLISERDQLP